MTEKCNAKAVGDTAVPVERCYLHKWHQGEHSYPLTDPKGTWVRATDAQAQTVNITLNVDTAPLAAALTALLDRIASKETP